MKKNSDKLIKNDIEKAINIYNNKIVFDAINEYCNKNKMSLHDFLEKIKNEGFVTILEKDIPEYESGQRDFLTSGAKEYLINLLDLDLQSFRKYKPYNFDKLYLDNLWSLEYNFNYDLDAKNYVQHFLHQKDFSLFLDQYDLKNFKEIKIEDLREYDNLKDINYDDIWYSFYDKKSNNYYEASPDMLTDIIELYYQDLIDNYKAISGNKAKTVKDTIKKQPTPYIHIINTTENE